MGKVFNIGVNDADYVVVKYDQDADGKRVRVWTCPFYRCWHNMLKRCYSVTNLVANPTYKDCTVCKEWLIFSNFKSWMEKQDWEGKQLDKDLLIRGNKLYSPETCVFISGSLNTFISGDNGVSFDKQRCLYKAYISVENKYVYLGRFSTEAEAYSKWLDTKHSIACDLATKESNPAVKNALMCRYLP